MDNLIVAVLIHEQTGSFEDLKGTLSDLSVETYCAQEWSGANDLIARYQPLVVFVDLPNWNKFSNDIHNTTAKTDHDFNIVVVGLLPDIERYVSAIERGAFSYIAPPLSHEGLTEVVHAAAMDARDRRGVVARRPLAHTAP